jgi:hypothetical protein
MASTYSDYNRDRIGWFFGLSGWQLGVLSLTSLPVFWSVQRGAWTSAAELIGGWAVVLMVTVVPVRGRSATGWAWAATRFTVGGLLGWTAWRSKATRGQVEDLAEVDLPGILQGVEVHDGPPQGALLTRVAIIQSHAAKTWAVTAAVVHPGIGMSDGSERDRQGRGLSELLDLASRTGLVDEILFTVRTVPDDGAERDLWIDQHRRPGGPALSRQVNDDLRHSLTTASVRTEAFVTVVVPETRISRDAREAGGGLDGRARVLYGLMAEVEAQLRGGLGMTTVTWLTSPQLALACRTGFAPADRAGIVDALAAREVDPGVNADVPWAMAGPSGGHPEAAGQGCGDGRPRPRADPR